MAQYRDTEEPSPRRRRSGGGMGMVAILIALIFIVGPFAVPVAIPATSQVMLVGFGVLLLFLGSVIVTITRLYHKAAADEAFVRTGMGGAKAIVDGGSIVIPVVHEIIPVSLKTMKLVVERHSETALITGDNLRADVTAEFFIKVAKDKDSVIAAATSLGEKAVNPKQVQDTVFEKLVNALRTVAATKQLSELHTKRSEFAAAVQEIVAMDLKHNGLTLESTTISRLDQTPMVLDRAKANVFDAQGAKRAADIIQAALVEQNQITRNAELRIAEQDTTTAMAVALKKVEKETAEANRDRDIKVVKATTEREAAIAAAEQQKQTGVAVVEKDREIALADVDKDQQVAVAGARKDQAVRTAEIEKDKTVEVTRREADIAIAKKETERADAEAIKQGVEATAEEARQRVTTVTVRATAEREKQRTIIDRTAQAETKKIDQNTQADIAAYAVTVHAQAEKEAADNLATAKRTRAEAEKTAQVLEADGKTAVEMVPVSVQRERVAVERQDLENKQNFQAISKDLQVALAQIEASKEVQIALASAMGTAFSQAKITLWGTPEQATQMMQKFLTGQGVGALLEGLTSGSAGDGNGAVAGAAQMLTTMLERFTGVKLDPGMVSKMLHTEEAAAKK